MQSKNRRECYPSFLYSITISFLEICHLLDIEALIKPLILWT